MNFKRFRRIIDLFYKTIHFIFTYASYFLYKIFEFMFKNFERYNMFKNIKNNSKFKTAHFLHDLTIQLLFSMIYTNNIKYHVENTK